MVGLNVEQLRYAERAEGDLWVTVYREETAPVTSVVLYFHGGGWAAGTRDLNADDTRLLPLVRPGTAVVSAGYRLTSSAVWPAQLQDAGDAFEWTLDHFPGAAVFPTGSSAGGHLAGLLGLNAWERLTGRSHTRTPAGVITYAAVADPLEWDRERLEAPLPLPGTFAHWSYQRHGQWPPGGLGRRLLDNADQRVSARLVNHVGTGSVPFLIVHGDRDTCVSYRQSVRLFDVISQRGGRAFLLEVSGADHEDPAFGAPVVRGAISGFIEQFATVNSSDAEPDQFTAEHAQWHRSVEDRRASAYGPLSVTALHWLASASCTFPDIPGTWRDGGGGVVIASLDATDGVRLEGEELSGEVRLGPLQGQASLLLDAGERRIELAPRSGSIILRVRDPRSPDRIDYAGTGTFPPDPRWRIRARFERLAAEVTVDTVVDGAVQTYRSPGAATFEVDGTPAQLMLFETGEPSRVRAIFSDGTGKDQTFPAARSVEAIVDGDEVIIDFNRATNPPCAYSAGATCPLPPAENRLGVRIEAGELRPGLEPAPSASPR